MEDEKIVIATDADNYAYNKEVIERNMALSALNERIEKDYLQLSGYVFQNNEANEKIYSSLDIFEKILQTLNDIYNQMHREVTFNAVIESGIDGFNQGYNSSAPIDMFLKMIDPLLIALEKLQNSVLSKIGIDYIPVIPHVREVILNIRKIAEAASKLPQKDKDNAAKDAANSKETGNSLYDRIVFKLKEVFFQALEVIQKIISCIAPFLIMMLIDKLKPVAQSFGLALGEIYQIAETTYSVAKLLIYNQAALLDMFVKIIKGSVDEVWNMVQYYIQGPELPADADIDAIVKDIVSCDLKVQDNTLQIDLIKRCQELYSKKTALDLLRRSQIVGNNPYRELQNAVTEEIPKDISGIEKKIDVFKDTISEKFEQEYKQLYYRNVVSPTQYASKTLAASSATV